MTVKYFIQFHQFFVNINSKLIVGFWSLSNFVKFGLAMEQRTLKNVNKYLNLNIYSYLEKSGGQNTNLYLNVVHF